MNPANSSGPPHAVPGISVIINTYNHEASIELCLAGVRAQQLGATPWELIIVDDGSDDRTPQLVGLHLEQTGHPPSKYVQLHRKGGVACRQHGIDLANHELVLLLGGDFILTDPTVLQQMLAHLHDDVPFVSLYGPHGGIGTLYRADVVEQAGGFCLAFNRFGSGFRDDSDLHYRLQDCGYHGVHLSHLHQAFRHLQPRPPGLVGAVQYALHRVAVHQLDPLLFRRHPQRFAADFPLLLRRVVDPVGDFRRATGLWRRGGSLELSSPQGIVLLPGTNAFYRLLAVVGGLAYVVAVHCARAAGSVRYRTVLL